MSADQFSVIPGDPINNTGPKAFRGPACTHTAVAMGGGGMVIVYNGLYKRVNGECDKGRDDKTSHYIPATNPALPSAVDVPFLMLLSHIYANMLANVLTNEKI